ncbi:peptidoglycan -binding protein [Paracoccaceae bacterium GXU_MW_L88]
MALARAKRQRFTAAIWPGFVDAITALLLVMMFVLSIFMVAQFVLRDQIGAQENELSRLNAAVAGLNAELALSSDQISELERQAAAQMDEEERLQLALAAAREEIDAETEAARLAAAQREAVEALLAERESELQTAQTELEEAQTGLDAAQTELDDAETARLANAAALEALRERYATAETDMTDLAALLEAERAKSETAEAEAAALSERTQTLAQQIERMNTLLANVRSESADRQEEIDSLGGRLNSALATIAEQEAAERARLAEEAEQLRRAQSDFLGRVRDVMEGREGVRMVGDRFVFSSEVLFDPGSAQLGPEGRAQISSVAEAIREISADIPEEVNWVLRVDGHTDVTPVGSNSRFEDNWDLSNARALSVVRYLVDEEGIPASRLAATGFGEFQPLASGRSPEALAANRRIELKFTER